MVTEVSHDYDQEGNFHEKGSNLPHEHKVWYTVDEWIFDLHYHGQVNPLNLYPSSLGPLLWCGLLISESSSIML